MVPAFLTLAVYNIPTLNGVVHRDFEVVEQPISLPGFTQRLVNESKVFMEEQVSKPFLLILSFLHVHDSMFTSEEFKGHSKYGDYGDNIEKMDWAVGEIKKSIAAMGQRQNTFVYLTSDHGGHIENLAADGSRIGGHNGRFRGGKMMGGMEGGIRVPAVAMYPNVIPEGSEVNEPTSLMDIFPTILGITGHPLVTDRIIDGKDMMPLMKKSENKSAHDVIFHYCAAYIHAARLIDHQDNSIWKVHFATPKWLPGTERCELMCSCDARNVNYHNPPLMYELNSDPYESHAIDIKSNVKYGKILERIRKVMDEHKKSIVAVPSQLSFSNAIYKPWLQPCCKFSFVSVFRSRLPNTKLISIAVYEISVLKYFKLIFCRESY
ncbi:ARSD (predicted) [Pycnogonum litorale]